MAYRLASSSSTTRMVTADSSAMSRLRGSKVEAESRLHERLSDVVERGPTGPAGLLEDRRPAHAQPAPFVVAEVLRGVDDHRDPGRSGGLPEPFEDLESCHIRHDQIEEDHSRTVIPSLPQALLSI